jgi:hypothetical protein
VRGGIKLLRKKNLINQYNKYIASGEYRKAMDLNLTSKQIKEADEKRRK